MQITIDLPDALQITEADLRTELAIILFRQKNILIEQAAQLAQMDVDDFYDLLVDRQTLTRPSDPSRQHRTIGLMTYRSGCHQS